MKTNVILLSCIAWLMVACSPSTQLTKSWTDPSVTPETVKPFKKVLVIARVNDETSNRIAEDKIVAQVKAENAVPSYAFLSPADTAKKVVNAKLQEAGFDGLIVMRLTEVNKSLDYQPGTGYRGFYGGFYGSPGTLSEDQTFYVETSIYSLETEKLLWSGTTSTFNPSQFDKAIDDIIYTIKTELTKKGLLPE